MTEQQKKNNLKKHKAIATGLFVAMMIVYFLMVYLAQHSDAKWIGYVEAFAPLIGADVTMRNNMQFRAQYNRDRMFMLGLVNHTLTEDAGNEYILGFGYIMKDLKLKMNFNGKERTMKSDLNIRGDFSLRDSQTRITNILQNDSQVTGGQRMMSIKLSADYNMSQNFNIRLFYDQLLTRYKISTAFPLSTIRAGLTATFTFAGSGGGF